MFHLKGLQSSNWLWKQQFGKETASCADSAPQHQLDSGVLKPVSVCCMFVSDVILRSEIPQIQQRYSGDHSGKACVLIWLGRSPSERSSPSPDTVVYENLVLIKADHLQMSAKATYLRGSIKTWKCSRRDRTSARTRPPTLPMSQTISGSA